MWEWRSNIYTWNQEELDKIASLVRTSVGYDQERGDQIEVINMQFASIDVPLQLKETLLWV